MNVPDADCTTDAGTSERTALVTGATGAIGRAIARQIAAKPGYAIVLLARNAARAEHAVREIAAATGNRQVSWELVDLSRRESIMAFAGRWRQPVHLLVNNAALAPRSRQETPQGIEMQFAVNVLGYYWLTLALQNRLIEGAPARVVNVASYWAGDLDLTDPEFRRRAYDQHRAYRQSKQAERMLTVYLAAELGPAAVTVNACHPGDVDSALSRALGFGGHESPDQGARTPVWLATDPACADLTGRYFEGCREVRCRFAADASQIARLAEICRGYEG
ncbi:SDR family NAD(P)-dependent oxidoreductase [Accumulibacter sp.]|uniref:SDR family NAD(P)-dependent oxidoreductase n=1 Tax=Accumulibacter sp. TaxID=2053492 RepID=UPI0025F6B55B|nr:SDR family NAD(P)-dependent oxidoreductase [Accumulibacter sp.]MCM8626458.1 SDR family NAD(P)-dependent oxidoreductase [Accumulibacter sp.]